MNMYCDFCAAQIHVLDLFCPYCGKEAPRRTLPPQAARPDIPEGVYCNWCQCINMPDAQYCCQCGENLYKRSSEATVFCPKCASENKQASRFCVFCQHNFETWFSSTGLLLERLGYRGDFTLYETMTRVYYHFISSGTITIGRDIDNDIVIPCPWVSGHHCVLDVERAELTDKGSTNGTYINRNNTRIQTIPLSIATEMNIAGVFTFEMKKKDDIYAFRLTAILSQKELKQIASIDELDTLRAHYYILARGQGALKIRKMDGEIVDRTDVQMETFTISMRNGGYYFTDEDRDMSDVLLKKTNNHFPPNWKVTLR